MNYKVRIYKSKSGKYPFNEWLDRLDNKTVARIDARLTRFELGLIGDAKKLKGADIHEARFDFGPGSRIYFGILRREFVLLVLIGGDKKSQKRDVATAQKYWEHYLEDQNG